MVLYFESHFTTIITISNTEFLDSNLNELGGVV